MRFPNWKRKVREHVWARWRKTICRYGHLGLSPSEYDKTQVGARRTSVTSLNIKERARTWVTGAIRVHSQPILNRPCRYCR